MGYIYKIINDINDKVYVGQTMNTIQQRWTIHKQMSKTYSNIIYKAIRKYGIEHFSIVIIEECDNNQLDERERYWIEYYDSYENGYNMTSGGTGVILEGHTRSKYADEIIALYDKNPNISYAQIAKKVGCSTCIVSNVLNRTGRPSTNTNISKSVLQYDLEGNFIQEFKSARQAAKSLGKSSGSSILKVCRHEPWYQTAYGYIWKFKK